MSHYETYEHCKKLKECFPNNTKGLRFKAFLWSFLAEVWFLSICISPLTIGLISLHYYSYGSLSLYSEEWIKSCLLINSPILIGLKFYLFKSSQDPTKKRVSRQEAPELWAIVDEISNGQIKRVYIIDIDNIAVHYHQAIPFIPYYRSGYLGIGIYLFHYLNNEELKAMIRHELGHIVHPHQNTVRLGKRLMLLSSCAIHKHEIRWLFRLLGGRKIYTILNAYYLTICQDQEREADRYSIDRTSKSIHCSTHIKLTLGRELYNKFNVINFGIHSYNKPEAPKTYCSELCHEITQTFTEENVFSTQNKLNQKLSSFLNKSTRLNNTHPVGIDRVLAHHEFIDKPSIEQLSSLIKSSLKEPMCSSLLSQSTLDSFIKSIDNYLHNELQKSWQDDYKKRQNLHAELQACDNKLTGEKEAWRKIEILAQVTDYDDYKNLLDCFLEKYNKHQLANYHQGLQLHREHDSQGITTLIKASKEWSPIQHFAFWLLSELSQDKEKAENYYIQYLKALDYFEEINERCA